MPWPAITGNKASATEPKFPIGVLTANCARPFRSGPGVGLTVQTGQFGGPAAPVMLSPMTMRC
jgi:hypothetical protein